MQEKLRLLLDTNIYGKIFEQEDEDLIPQIVESNKILIYGFTLIRKELRNIPSKIKHKGRSYRGKLLDAYDQITGEHEYDLTPGIIKLAQSYAKNLGNENEKEKFWKDFLIVACATIHQLDIVVSEDRLTLASDYAQNIYKAVNENNGLRTPKFYTKNEFDKLI